MAVVGNSYLYHMRKDLVENIQPGVATNMGLNVLALLRHLTSPASPLASLAESGYTKPSTVFFSPRSGIRARNARTVRAPISMSVSTTDLKRCCWKKRVRCEWALPRIQKILWDR